MVSTTLSSQSSQSSSQWRFVSAWSWLRGFPGGAPLPALVEPQTGRPFLPSLFDVWCWFSHSGVNSVFLPCCLSWQVKHLRPCSQHSTVSCLEAKLPFSSSGGVEKPLHCLHTVLVVGRPNMEVVLCGIAVALSVFRSL